MSDRVSVAPKHQLKFWSLTQHAPAAESPTVATFVSWCASLVSAVRDEPQITDMIWQAEETAEGGLHLQGFLQTSSRLYLAQVKDLLRTVGFSDSVHLDPASNSGKEALKRYAMKEARVAGPWAKNARRLAELLKKQTDEKDFKPYSGEDLPRDLIPWQENLRRYLLSPVNNREVIVAVDESGGAGKTTFCKFMAFHHRAGILSYGRANDLLYNVTQMSQIPTIMLVDLTRAKPDEIGDNELWAAIEQIKNGLVVCNKYKSVTITFAPPHVVVFCNYKPNPNVLSSDRWNVTAMSVRDRPRVSGVRTTFKWDVVYPLPGAAAALAAQTGSRPHRLDFSDGELESIIADHERESGMLTPPPSPVSASVAADFVAAERKHPVPSDARAPSPVRPSPLVRRNAVANLDPLPEPDPKRVKVVGPVPVSVYSVAMRHLYSLGYWQKFPLHMWPQSLLQSVDHYRHTFAEEPSSAHTHAQIDSEIAEAVSEISRGVRAAPVASSSASASSVSVLASAAVAAGTPEDPIELD